MCIMRLALASSVLIGAGVAAVAHAAAAGTLRIGEVDGPSVTAPGVVVDILRAAIRA